MSNLAELCVKYEVRLEVLPTLAPNGTEWNSYHWQVRVGREGRGAYTSVYSIGLGHGSQPPTIMAVLSSLLSDARGTEESFEEWASNLGYDTDSRKAERTYDACRECRHALLRILGPAYYKFDAAASEE